MDVPGELSADNPYLTNERVGSIRVTANGGGSAKPPSYMDRNISDYAAYDDIYSELSQMDEWELIKDKFYFYTVDEPLPPEYNSLAGRENITVDSVKEAYEKLILYWEDPRVVVPYNDNQAYPYHYYTEPLDYNDTAGIRDGIQETFDTGSITIWCPQTIAFTPSYELDAYGYQGTGADKIRNMSCTMSGAMNLGQSYFNWESIYGDFYDRIHSYMYLEEQKSSDKDLWAYYLCQPFDREHRPADKDAVLAVVPEWCYRISLLWCKPLGRL